MLSSYHSIRLNNSVVTYVEGLRFCCCTVCHSDSDLPNGPTGARSKVYQWLDSRSLKNRLRHFAHLFPKFYSEKKYEIWTRLTLIAFVELWFGNGTTDFVEIWYVGAFWVG